MRTYLVCAEKGVSSVDEKKQEVTVINWGTLYYTCEMSGQNYKVAQNLRVSLDFFIH